MLHYGSLLNKSRRKALCVLHLYIGGALWCFYFFNDPGTATEESYFVILTSSVTLYEFYLKKYRLETLEYDEFRGLPHYL